MLPMNSALTNDVIIGTSPAGVTWVAYAGRHTAADVARMRERLAALHARRRVTVTLTWDQADFLRDWSACSGLDLEWTRISVTGTTQNVRGLLDHLKMAEADIGLATANVRGDGSAAQVEARCTFAVRQRLAMIARIRRGIERATKGQS